MCLWMLLDGYGVLSYWVNVCDGVVCICYSLVWILPTHTHTHTYVFVCWCLDIPICYIITQIKISL